MDTETKFETIWNRVDDLDVPREVIEWCPYARKFSEWAASLIETSTQPELVSVNQAKILLIDKYFEYRSYVPRSHRTRIGAIGHHCIYQVFELAYEKLKRLELSLTPPMLFIPPPPLPPTPIPQIAGIFLGDLEK